MINSNAPMLERMRFEKWCIDQCRYRVGFRFVDSYNNDEYILWLDKYPLDRFESELACDIRSFCNTLNPMDLQQHMEEAGRSLLEYRWPSTKEVQVVS